MMLSMFISRIMHSFVSFVKFAENLVSVATAPVRKLKAPSAAFTKIHELRVQCDFSQGII